MLLYAANAYRNIIAVFLGNPTHTVTLKLIDTPKRYWSQTTLTKNKVTKL